MHRLSAAVAALALFAGSPCAEAQPTAVQIRAIRLAQDALAPEERRQPGLWFADMASVAVAQADMGNPDDARATHARLLAQTERLEDPVARNVQYAVVARLQARAGFAADARSTAARTVAAESRGNVLREMAAAHASAGRVDDARAAVAQIPPGEARERAISAAMQEAAEEGLYDAVRLVAQDSAEPITRAIADSMIAAQAVKAQRFADARGAIARIADTGARVHALYELGAAQRRAGLRDDARATLQQAVAAWRPTAPSFTREIYVKLIAEELSLAGAFADALALVPFAREDERGALYQSISADQAWDGAFDDAAATLARIDSSEAWRLDESRATILAARVGAGREPAEALMRLSDVSLREELQRFAAAEAFARNDAELARDLLRRAAQSASASASTPWRERDESLLDTAEAQIAQSLLADAQITVAAIRGAALHTDALCSLAQAHATRGDRASAAATFAEAQSVGQNLPPEDYAFIVEEMVGAGLLAEALAAARALPAGDFDRDWARQRAFGAVATAHAKAGAIDQAFGVAGEIGDPFNRARAYIEIAVSHPS